MLERHLRLCYNLEKSRRKFMNSRKTAGAVLGTLGGLTALTAAFGGDIL